MHKIIIDQLILLKVTTLDTSLGNDDPFPATPLAQEKLGVKRASLDRRKYFYKPYSGLDLNICHYDIF